MNFSEVWTKAASVLPKARTQERKKQHAGSGSQCSMMIGYYRITCM